MQKLEITSLPKSLSEARATGGSLYYTGVKCKQGHLTYRYVKDRVCSACVKAKVKKAATQSGGNARRWAKKNTEQLTLIYEKRKKYYAETIEKRRKEKQRSVNKLKHNSVWVEKHRATGKQWKQENPGKVRADTVKRRTAKINRTPAWLSFDDHWIIEQAYELAALRTKLFGFAWHVDHIIPLQGKYVSGLHVPVNLQVIPGIDNVRKANTYLTA